MKATFRPLRRARRSRRALLFILGPMVWVVAIVVTAWVLDHFNAIELGLLVAAVSLVAWIFLLLGAREGRLREERRA